MTPAAGPTRRGVLGLALAALGTAGCSGGDLVPGASSSSASYPSLTPAQAAAVLEEAEAALAAGSSGRDVSKLGQRVAGPLRAATAASIKVQKALDLDAYTPPLPDKPRLYLTRTTGWPRWFMTAGSAGSSATPVVEVLRCTSARTPYALWGLLTLLPGESVPDVAPSTEGSDQLAADATGLADTPLQVMTRYTDLLNRGKSSSNADFFAEDDFRTQLLAQLRSDRAAIAAGGLGEVTATHTLAEASVMALATTDGGALVVGRVDQTYTATVDPDVGSVTLDEQLAALAGEDTATSELVRVAAQTLLFAVPPEASSDKVRLIAASKSDIEATAT